MGFQNEVKIPHSESLRHKLKILIASMQSDLATVASLFFIPLRVVHESVDNLTWQRVLIL